VVVAVTGASANKQSERASCGKTSRKEGAGGREGMTATKIPSQMAK